MQYCVSVEARRTGHEEALFTTWDQFQPTTIGNRLAVLLIRCWPPILCFFLMQEVRTSVLADSGSDPIWDCEGLCREKCV